MHKYLPVLLLQERRRERNDVHPGDAVTVAVQFAKLPDGTNHVATVQVNGVSKQLGVLVQNSAYQRMQ